MKEKPGLFYGWVILATVFVVMAVGYALRNTFSVFYPIIVEDFGWGRGNTALMFSISIIVYGCVAPLAGNLVNRFEPRLILSLGVVIAGAGVALCSLASKPWHFYLFFGVVGAIGQGLIATTPMVTLISNWFVAKRGQVFGILTAGFGTSLLVAPIAQFLISRFGWQTAYTIEGLLSIALMLPLCLFIIRRSPHDKGLVPYGLRQISSRLEGSHSVRETAQSQEKQADISVTLGQALKTSSFWLLFLISFLVLGIAESTALAHQIYFLRDAGYEPMRTATIYAVFGILYVIGNLGAYYSDRLGRERIFIAGCLLSTGAVALLFLITDTSKPWLPFIFAVILGLGLGALAPVLFAKVADLFHGKYFGAILGFIVLGYAMGGAFSPWLAGFLHDTLGNYTVTYFFLLGSFLISALLMRLMGSLKVLASNPADSLASPGGKQ